MSEETFARVGRFAWGYDPKDVDAFLQEAKGIYSSTDPSQYDETLVRNASFNRKRHGYNPVEVDAALDRLEAAFIQAKRAAIVEREGENTWLNDTYALAKSLYPRLLRPEGERFAQAKEVGYSKIEVDALIDRLAAYFDGKEQLSSTDVRLASFTMVKKKKAYDTAVVDVYLDRAISVLVAVE